MLWTAYVLVTVRLREIQDYRKECYMVCLFKVCVSLISLTTMIVRRCATGNDGALAFH